MNNTVIGTGCELNKSIIAENVEIQNQVRLGIGEEEENETHPQIYNHGLVCIGEKSILPEGLTVGKNACIYGVTKPEDYQDLMLPSGKTLIKAGDE